ncbi:MAG: hypothetical protein K1X67_05165 [Fimbriimonadaceae bacterium]|nr:hypothetical protein [Fimbriimonadaceae bacterium]
MSADFFPSRPNANPTIYAYEDTNPQYAGLLKVGYTTLNAAVRVAQQNPTLRPGELPYRIVLEESAMRNDGSAFTDRDVHRCSASGGFSIRKASGSSARPKMCGQPSSRWSMGRRTRKIGPELSRCAPSRCAR